VHSLALTPQTGYLACHGSEAMWLSCVNCVQDVNERDGRFPGVQTLQQAITTPQDAAMPTHFLSVLFAGTRAADKWRWVNEIVPLFNIVIRHFMDDFKAAKWQCRSCFWAMERCRSGLYSRRFGDPYCLYLQGDISLLHSTTFSYILVWGLTWRNNRH
jgi:hypothetical protein